VYEGRLDAPFDDEEELISKIKSVWKECVNKEEIRKAMKEFTGRLKMVKARDGSSIKMHYG